MRIFFLFFALLLTCCTAKTAIPTEFPTPPPPPAATPQSKLEFKRDVELEKQFAAIASDAKGKVGVAAVVLETGEAALLNAEQHYPMQSVYKLPISMAVMDQVRQEKLDLDEKIAVTKDDFVRQGQHSPLRDKNPNGGEFTIRELIQLSLVESDGTASDVLMRVAGGADEIQSYLTQIGILDMKVVNSEKEIGRDWETQYQNWATPTAAAELLRFEYFSVFTKRDQITSGESEVSESIANKTTRLTKTTEENRNALLLFKYMLDSVTGPKRLKGLLPKGNSVAHKTGTGGTQNGITSATNDVGIIYLPNDKTLAVAVFVSDSPADEKTRESVIARIAKAAWDKWSR